jgi:molybdopterin molybdotransferase
VSDLPVIEEALALVLGRVRPLPEEQVAVVEASGRWLARDAASRIDLPPFASSAMDGFAVRAADTPGTLAIVGHSAAGRPARESVGEGEAVEISTGAVVPEGATAVVPVERTTREEGRVTVQSVAERENIRPRGGDARAGDVVVAAGTRLGPPQLAALAAAGVANVACARRPRVAVLATGSELRAPGEPLEAGQIYESNSVLVAAQSAQTGAIATVLPSAADDEAATRAALEAGLTGDVLVTSGGVSVGEHDLVRAGLVELGAEEVFWRVAVKPGKPVAFSVRNGTLVFGLPGNPVSSLVAFELFVRPALAALQGARDPGPGYLSARLGRSVRRAPERDALVRARTRVDDQGVHVDPVDGQDSHMITRAAGADALVLVRRGDGELRAGDQVSYLPI